MTLEIGTKAQFPALLRTFEPGVHDAMVLDDVRDLAFLSENQEKLQAKYNAIIEFGTTPSEEYAYHHYFFQVPIAATISRDTKNREWLEPGDHDWLWNERNRVVVELKEAPYGASSASSSSAAACSAFPALLPPAPPASTPAPGAEESQQSDNPALMRRLQALAALKRGGALTAGEFEAAKKRVLWL
jgi:hypothetical protein